MVTRVNIIIGVLFFILLFVGTWNLSKSPATWFDEGINLGIARSLVENGVFSLSVAPDTFVEERQFLITSNYPVLLPSALSMKLFGFNLTAARTPMVLFLILFAIASFAIVRRLYSREAAIMSLALLVTFVPLYGNGKNVLGEVPGLVFFFIALLLLPRAFNFRRLFFAGLCIGLAVATKPFFLIIPIALGVAEILLYRKSGVFWNRVGSLILGMALPILGWLSTILPSFSLKSFSSTFLYYGNSYASGDFIRLITENALRFFTESTPLHFALLFLVAAVLLYLKKRRGEEITETEIILGIFTLLTLAFYLKTPGWYRYFFPAHVILFLLFPYALSYIFNRKVAIFSVLLLFIVQGGMLVSKRHDSLYYSDEATRFSKEVMAETPSDSDILFINSPSAAFLISGRESYQYLQINEERHIGHASLLNIANTPFSYLVISEPLPETKITDLTKALEEEYALVKTLGHLSLFKYRTP